MTLNSAYLIVKHFGKLRDFLQFWVRRGGLGCIICEIWQGTSNLRRGSGAFQGFCVGVLVEECACRLIGPHVARGVVVQEYRSIV